MPNAPFFYLRPEERILRQLRAAPTYGVALFAPLLLPPTLLLAVALAARAFVPALADVPLWAPLAGWALLLVAAALFAWRRAATSEYALTDERIYARVGKLVTSVHFTTHDKITDIHYRQGPLERVFGIGSITFATAGGDVRVAGVREPIALKEAAEAARDAFVRRLLADAPVAPALTEATTPAPSVAVAPAIAAPRPELPPWTGPRPDYLQPNDAPVWYAKPRPISAVSSLRALVGLAAIALFSGFAGGPGRAWLPAVAVVVAIALVTVRLLQLRRTEYTVTDRRVYARRGLLGTTIAQLTYDKITDITYTQDVLGRIFGYGSVSVNTAGSNAAPIVMAGLASPLEAKETIERWRDASLGSAR